MITNAALPACAPRTLGQHLFLHLFNSPLVQAEPSNDMRCGNGPSHNPDTSCLQ